MNQQLFDHLLLIYGADQVQDLADRLGSMVVEFAGRNPQLTAKPAVNRVSEQDSILITYGDKVQEEGIMPLESLTEFLKEMVGDTISTVHILPFYPYSSDDGFSVIDYKQVDPNLGSWEDVDQIGRSFRLMFDAVVNHISVQSDWFAGFLNDDPRFRNFFTLVEQDFDFSQVFRPRTLPLLTEVETAAGPKQVWTTFSADQVDLNYAEPQVLFEVIDTLLFYVAHGAEFIRLDAIAYIWKESGSSCIHLPQTHEIIRLMRTVLDQAAPHVAIITETNVPHADNISYFGNGFNEAQMVYNFSLPPLTLHAFQTGTAEPLSSWARTLTLPSKGTTFFNFLASHDGIGLTPARGLLSELEIQSMADRVEALGGYVSYKINPDGSKSAYELNINFLDALRDPENLQEEIDLEVKRFIASQAIMLVLRGVPGIYFHSLFGSRNWQAGVQLTGRNRSINREKLNARTLKAELSDQESLRHKVHNYYCRLLNARRAEPAFHPNGDQYVLDIDPVVFAVRRTSVDGRSTVLCLQHVSAVPRRIHFPTGQNAQRNILNGEIISGDLIDLAAYDVLWLQPIKSEQ